MKEYIIVSGIITVIWAWYEIYHTTKSVSLLDAIGMTLLSLCTGFVLLPIVVLFKLESIKIK
jgi:hypothetical protein